MAGSGRRGSADGKTVEVTGSAAATGVRLAAGSIGADAQLSGAGENGKVAGR
jgi:hypothetical protein